MMPPPSPPPPPSSPPSSPPPSSPPPSSPPPSSLSKSATSPIRVAVVIGINYVGSPFQLNGCIHDARHIQEMLVSKFHFPLQNITMLCDPSIPGSMRPTRMNILRAILSAVSATNSHPQSELWIYYSGHGSQVVDTNGDEEDGMDEVIVPIADERGVCNPIVDDELFSLVSRSLCPTVVLVDSCHSGSMCDLQYETSLEEKKLIERKVRPGKTIQNPHIVSISGCSDHQTSMDTYSRRLGKHVGAFTDAFIQSLDARNYKGGIMDIYRDTCTRLEKAEYSQAPILSSSMRNPVYKFSPEPIVSPVVKPPSIVRAGQARTQDQKRQFAKKQVLKQQRVFRMKMSPIKRHYESDLPSSSKPLLTNRARSEFLFRML